MTLFELEQAMLKAGDIKSINSLFKQYLKQLGISSFSFTYYATVPGSTNKIKHDFYSNSFKLWHKHYIESGYEDVDSSFDVVNQRTLPMYWDVAEQISNARTAKEKRMREDSYQFGARQGLSIPIYGLRGELATFVVVQLKGESPLNNWQNLQYELMSAGHIYYNALQPFLVTAATKENPLTDRELQCLELVSKQLSVDEVAKQLSISARTVNFHIQNSNKKLGVKNKHQAIAKLIKLGFLE